MKKLREGITLIFINKSINLITPFIIIITAFLVFFVSLQVFAQVSTINDLFLNPLFLDFAILTKIMSTLSSPFSIYSQDPYSSYDPFSTPYTTIPSSPGYNLLPYPFHNISSASSNSFYNGYEVYNPVSFLNTGYNDSFNNILTFQTIAPFLSPAIPGSFFPGISAGFYPGLLPAFFPL
jgi:hypothetical protein